MRNNRFGGDRGFTLIELLIVIAIIGFLAAAILVAVDPVKRVKQARNAKRWSETNGILNAVLKKQVDDRAAFYGDASAPIYSSATYAQVIVYDRTGVDCITADAGRPACPGQTLDYATSTTACVAQLDDLETSGYLAEIPVDPIGTGNTPEDSPNNLPLGNNNTGYYIHKLANGRIEVGSCYAEEGETIRVKR